MFDSFSGMALVFPVIRAGSCPSYVCAWSLCLKSNMLWERAIKFAVHPLLGDFLTGGKVVRLDVCHVARAIVGHAPHVDQRVIHARTVRVMLGSLVVDSVE